MVRSPSWRQIEAFRAVILTGSMTGGGRLMSLTQPAISRLIRDLELDLKLPLFRRNGSVITPTREAMALFREVERHFLSSQRILDAAAAIRRQALGTLRVLAIPALSMSCLPQIAAKFLAEHPQTALSLLSATSVDILDRMRSGGVDLGLGVVPADRIDVDHDIIVEAEAVCLVPTGHPLAGRTVVDVRDLDGQPLVGLAPSSLMRLQLEAHMMAADVHVRMVMEGLYSATVARCVAEGLGIAITDPFAPIGAGVERMHVTRFTPAIPYRVSAIYSPDSGRDPFLVRFAEVAAAEIACALGRAPRT
jgi:DNA-binding transcriptional LysR family regulator